MNATDAALAALWVIGCSVTGYAYVKQTRWHPPARRVTVVEQRKEVAS
jgi:hypothetical protein